MICCISVSGWYSAVRFSSKEANSAGLSPFTIRLVDVQLCLEALRLLICLPCSVVGPVFPRAFFMGVIPVEFSHAGGVNRVRGMRYGADFMDENFWGSLVKGGRALRERLVKKAE
jgi:hypothetical protein